MEKRKDYISWNEYFMELALLSAKRSKDPKTQVGAVIINPENNHIVSIGYNGLPLGMIDDEICWDDSSPDPMKNKHNFVVHAEANAILNANQNLENCHMYVTMFPCNECAKLIAQVKIKKVFYLDDKYLLKDAGKAAKIIFDLAEIEVERWRKI